MKFGSYFKYIFAGAAFFLFAFSIRAAGPYATLSAFSGHIGAKINVSGGGFNPGEAVGIFIGDDSSPAGSATADAKGNFAAAGITIPNTAAPNVPLKIAAIGKTSGFTAQNSFYVQPYLPSLKVTSTGTTPLSGATINGSGFAPGEAVSIDFAGTALAAQADAKGNFKTAAQVPNVSADTYIVSATGSASGAKATWSFYVSGFYPNVSPSQFYLAPESVLKFSGSGFAPGENISVIVKGTGQGVANITADPKGSFKNAGAFTTDFSMAGKIVAFQFTGQKSQASASTEVQVGALNALLNAAPYFINPNYPVSFWGNGFGKNETINIFDSADPGKVLAHATADKNGNFTGASALIPYAFSGTTRTFHAVGARSGADTTVQINVGQLYPQLLPSAYFVKSAQEMKVYGFGFAPNELVDLTVNGKLLMIVKADAKTNIASDPLVVPFTEALAISAKGELSGAGADLKLTTAKFSPWVNASKYYVTPGGPISFTGSDFAPNEAVDVSIGQASGAIQPFAVLHTDENGALQTNTETFPFGTPTKVSFAFKGETSGAVAALAVDTAKFNPWLAADKYFAAPRDVVKVSGHGFAAGEKVRITAGPATIEAPTNTRGDTPTIQLTVPFGIGKEGLTIAFTGEQSGAQASTIVSVKTFLPSLSPSTYYFTPGQVFTVAGNGFAPDEPVKILLNGGEQATVQTDAKGHLVSPPLPISPLGADATIEFDGQLSKTSVSVKITVAKPQPTPAAP